MSDTLSHADCLVLRAPFAAHNHEFIRGYIYISEEAICERIEDVDPSWQWVIIEMRYENDMATVIGALTIKGVTRYGTGQQLAQTDKTSGKETVGESRKGATTDALKRAARLFGIGRYLLGCPKDVKDFGPALNKWLASLAAPAPINNVGVSGHGAQEHKLSPIPTGTGGSGGAPAWWVVLKEYKPFMQPVYFDQMAQELAFMVKEKKIHIANEENARDVIEKLWDTVIDLDALRAARKESAR